MIDQLNFNHLKLFVAVYKERNMTAAAKEVGLTQSGVSQHMKVLEESLGIKLFNRDRHKLTPTSAADLLFDQSIKGFNEIKYAVDNITENKELFGTVTLGIPIGFGKNIILPLLEKFSTLNPEVKFKIKIGFATEINNLILNREIDFAFVDDFSGDKKIQVLNVYREILKLYIHKSLLAKYSSLETPKLLTEVDLIAYDDNCPVLSRWYDHHLMGVHKIRNPKVIITDAEGVSEMILLRMGVGVLPEYLIRKLGKQKSSLVCLDIKKQPLKNSIGMAYLREKRVKPEVEYLITYLKDHLIKNS